MKSQDKIFTAIFVILIFIKTKGAWLIAMFTILLSAALFLIGNLFTAQRLSWYAAAILAIVLLKQLMKLSRLRE